MPRERLQKILARAGFGSRRKCEELVAAGRVCVDGEVADTPGSTADTDTDEITVDGMPINPPDPVYIMFNKPPGCITAAEDHRERRTVMDYLEDVPARVFHVGRLDMDTEGMLLFTNNGEYCQQVTHPSHKVFKTYEAVVRGVPGEDTLELLRKGVDLDDGRTAPALAELCGTMTEQVSDKRKPNRPPRPVKAAKIEISIREGRKRQVRRMFRAVGHPVIRLKRTRIGMLGLGDLPAGEWRFITPEEASLALRDEEGRPDD